MVSEELIAGCIRGDRKAQHAMYRALYPMMMSICTRYERDRQEAVARVNLGSLKILQSIATKPPGTPFEPWARRIMMNTVIDEFRKDRPRRQNEVSGTPEEYEHDGIVNEYLKHMEAEAFEAMLHALPPVSRHVFNMFALDGYSHAEIAQELGISTGTSKWHVSHARSILQKTLRAMAAKTVSAR
jgi:RNA polymerase sigma factor (sigma-70 family)